MRRGGDLLMLLYRECGLDDEQIAPVIRYQVSTGGTLDATTASKISIALSVIPKAWRISPEAASRALRSALLYQMIAGQDPRRRQANVARLMDMPMDKRNEKNLVLPKKATCMCFELGRQRNPRTRSTA